MCIYGAASLSPLFEGSSATTIPVVMWSDKQIFSSPNTQVVDTVSTGDVEYTLSSLFKVASNNKDSKVGSYLVNSKETPEVVVIFVEPELATDRVPLIASAYSSTTGGSFSNLKESVEAAKASLVMPYATVEEVSLLDDPLSHLFDSIKEGSIFVSRLAGSELFIGLGRQSGVKNVEINSLISELKSANAFTNGVTDLVVVCFDKPTTGKQVATFASHDELIGTISGSIRTATKGNYVAVYTANTPAASRLIWTFEQHSEVEFYHSLRSELVDYNCSDYSNCSNSTINYFPGPLIEVYLLVSILIAMAFTGGCAIFSLQTPDRWEAPRVKREAY